MRNCHWYACIRCSQVAVGIPLVTQQHFYQEKINKEQQQQKKKLMEIVNHDTVIHASQCCSIFVQLISFHGNWVSIFSFKMATEQGFTDTL